MALTTRSYLVSLKRLQPPPPSPAPPPSFSFSSRRFLSFTSNTTQSSTVLSTCLDSKRSSGIVNCLVSGVDGGSGTYDTRRLEFSREFAVIANMLKQIEPLDKSDISSGISASAKESMKQTLSTMLGLLPSEQFSVMVRVSPLPLHRLLVSSIVTGYTLWNAEYRISLMRNFDLSTEGWWSALNLEERDTSEVSSVESNSGGVDSSLYSCESCLDQGDSHDLQGLSPEALSYVQKLESELCAAKKELDDQKQEYDVQMQSNEGSHNNLLEYLRSLEANMVTELSKPASLEVKEVIHQLAENTLQKIFKEENTAEFEGGSAVDKEDIGTRCETISASRDYVAKLLFWCMMLGHHLRGLEYRLHLSCIVGVL